MSLTVLVVLFLLINAPGLFSLGYRLYYAPRVAALPKATPVTAADRLLVVSPHPDDETLCCAGTIQQALAAGAQVYVVWMTSGDGFEWDAIYLDRSPRPSPAELRQLAQVRSEEARAAASLLGVPQDHLFFLGYPDRGLLRLLLDYYSSPFTSKFSGVSAVPYRDALSFGAAYTGANLEADFKTVLDRVKPTLVLAPSPEDAHGDHRATGDLAIRVMSQRGELERLRYWIIHGGLEWPLPKGLHRGLPLEPPPRGKGLEWTVRDLTPEQIQKKLEAARAHKTQMKLLARFMLAFVRQNELISSTPLP